MLGPADLQQFRGLVNAEGIIIDLPDRLLRARLATLLLRFGLTSVEQLGVLLRNDWATWREVSAELHRPVPTKAIIEGKATRS